MICSECSYKNNCMYDPLEVWEERFSYSPCVWISKQHINYIRDKSFIITNNSNYIAESTEKCYNNTNKG